MPEALLFQKIGDATDLSAYYIFSTDNNVDKTISDGKLLIQRTDIIPVI